MLCYVIMYVTVRYIFDTGGRGGVIAYFGN